jgi:hypothetical protein
MYKYILAGVLIMVASATCLAAGTFYVAQDPTTKHCTVVAEKPDGVKMVMIGTTSYTSRKEAKTARKASTECNPPTSGGK